ncbi:MAG: hypothetical protein AVDCRST_MAG93-4412, partial [uncultured Chloroflexia bacterium]
MDGVHLTCFFLPFSLGRHFLT